MKMVLGRSLALAIFWLLFGLATGCDESEETQTVVNVVPDLSFNFHDGEVEEDVGPPDLGFLVDSGVINRNCNPSESVRDLTAVDPIGTVRTTSPRVVWTGLEWALIWLSASADGGPDTLWFQRYDSMGTQLGEPVEIGRSAVPQHTIVHTGENYVVAWANAPSGTDRFSGLRMRVVDNEGFPAVTSIDVQGTFDIQNLAFGWAPFSGGMLIYTKGRQGTGGVYALPVEPTFLPGDAIELAAGRDSGVGAVGVTYGDGVWGATWTRQGQPSDAALDFVLLDDNGFIVRQSDSVPGVGLGNLRMAYGRGVFGIAWTRRGEMSSPAPALTLVDGGGDVIATSGVIGPEGFAQVTEITWVGASGFLVAWQESLEGSESQIGITRITAEGLVFDPYIFPREEGHSHLGLVMSGRFSRLGVWFSADPAHSPSGYSAEARVVTGAVSPCN